MNFHIDQIFLFFFFDKKNHFDSTLWLLTHSLFFPIKVCTGVLFQLTWLVILRAALDLQVIIWLVIYCGWKKEKEDKLRLMFISWLVAWKWRRSITFPATIPHFLTNRKNNYKRHEKNFYLLYLMSRLFEQSDS